MSGNKKSLRFDPRWWKIGFPVLLLVLSLVTGTWGSFWREKAIEETGRTPSLIKAVWASVGHLIGETSFPDNFPDFGKGYDRMLILSRILGLVLISYAFFLLVHEHYQDLFIHFRIRFWRLLKKDYVVICGMGWKGYELAKKLLDDESQTQLVVGIDISDPDERTKGLCRRGMAFLKGDATTSEMLNKAEVIHASEVYVMAGNDEVNCRIAMGISSILPNEYLPKESKLYCFVVVEDRRQRYFLEDYATDQVNRLNIYCFSLNEQVARDIVRDRGLVASPNQHVHCVVVGNTAVARSVLVQCLRMLHLPTEQDSVVTVICEKCEDYVKSLYTDFPCLNPEQDLISPDFAREIFPKIRFVEIPKANGGWLKDRFELYDHIKPCWRTNLYMCVDDGIKSTALMDLVYRRMNWLAESMNGEINCTCHYNYPETDSELNSTEWKEFGDYKTTCISENIKRAAEPSLAQCVMDVWGSRKNWLYEPSWSKESSRQSADHIYIKLALAGLTVDSSREEIRTAMGEMKKISTASGWEKPTVVHIGSKLDELAKIEHRRWCAERLLGGWLPLSENDDREKWNQGLRDAAQDLAEKTESMKYVNKLKKELFRHGDLIPFKDLLECEIEKDYQIIAGILDMREHFEISDAGKD